MDALLFFFVAAPMALAVICVVAAWICKRDTRGPG